MNQTEFLHALGAQLDRFVEELLDAHRRQTSTLAVRDKGARVVPFTRSVRASTSPDTLVGFSMHETSGTAGATVVLRNGADPAGGLIVAVTLNPGESVRDWFGPRGVSFGDLGLYVDVAAGAVEGAVYLGSG